MASPQERYKTNSSKLLRQAGDVYSLLSTSEAPAELVQQAWRAFSEAQALAELIENRYGSASDLTVHDAA